MNGWKLSMVDQESVYNTAKREGFVEEFAIVITQKAVELAKMDASGEHDVKLLFVRAVKTAMREAMADLTKE